MWSSASGGPRSGSMWASSSFGWMSADLTRLCEIKLLIALCVNWTCPVDVHSMNLLVSANIRLL